MNAFVCWASAAAQAQTRTHHQMMLSNFLPKIFDRWVFVVILNQNHCTSNLIESYQWLFGDLFFFASVWMTDSSNPIEITTIERIESMFFVWSLGKILRFDFTAVLFVCLSKIAKCQCFMDCEFPSKSYYNRKQ